MLAVLATIEFHPSVWKHERAESQWGFELSPPASACDNEVRIMLWFGRWGCGVGWIPQTERAAVVLRHAAMLRGEREEAEAEWAASRFGFATFRPCDCTPPKYGFELVRPCAEERRNATELHLNIGRWACAVGWRPKGVPRLEWDF